MWPRISTLQVSSSFSVEPFKAASVWWQNLWVYQGTFRIVAVFTVVPTAVVGQCVPIGKVLGSVTRFFPPQHSAHALVARLQCWKGN